MQTNEQKKFVINYVLKWAGDIKSAENWYKTHYITSLGMTPNDAVDTGHFESLKEYLEIIKINGYA